LSIRHASEEGFSFPPGSKLERGSSISRPEFKIKDVPDAPSAPSATDVGTGRALNNGAATVSFTPAVTGGAATSYTVTSSPGSFTGTGASSPVTVTGLQSATSYTFSVSAANTTGTSSSSGASGSITATTVPGAPTVGTPTVPTGQAYGANANVSVPFTAPTASGGKAITSYTVTSSSGNTGSGSSSPIAVSDVVGTARTYTVTATNANGTGSASSASASTTPLSVPQAPTIGTPTVATGQAYTGSASVSVPFTAGATGGSSISSYTVTSSSGNTASGASSPISISDTVGTARTYTVTATNANGTSTASSASASTTPSSVPQAPTIGTATAGNASATVTYTANANGGAAVTTYTATSSPGGLTGTGASPITVSGLSNGTSYTFTVTATNSNGTSAASSASNSVTPIQPAYVGELKSSNAGYGIYSYLDASNNGYFVTINSGLTGGYGGVFYNVSPTGAVNSAVQWTASSGIQLASATVDSSGNIWIVGSEGSYPALWKLNSSGSLLFSKTWTAGVTSQANGITVDSSGNFYVAFISGAIAKYNSSGTRQWATKKNTGSTVSFNSVAIDSSGNVWGYGNVTGANNYSFLAEFNSSGTLQQQTVYNTSNGSSIGYSIVYDSASSSFYAVAMATDTNNLIVAATIKFDSSGNISWQRFGSEGSSRPGQGYNQVFFDGTYVYSGFYTGTSTGNLAKYNSSGTLQYAKDVYGNSGPGGYVTGPFARGNYLALTGQVYSSSAGGPNTFFASIPADGSKSVSTSTNLNTTFRIQPATGFTDAAGTFGANNNVSGVTTPTWTTVTPTESTTTATFASSTLTYGYTSV